jgi:hypothetical protein
MLAVELYDRRSQRPKSGGPIGRAAVDTACWPTRATLVIERTETDLLLVAERTDGVRSTIARLHRPGPRGEDGFGAFERPPGVWDPVGIDAAILGAIAGIRTARRERGGAALQPVTEEEFRAWQEARGAGDAEGGRPRNR